MDDKEKFELAKKRYEEFMNRMNNKFLVEENNELHASYVELKDEIVEDYYWSDHDITPTALLQWFKKYNKNRNQKNIVSVTIPNVLYDKLVTMYENYVEPLEVEGIKVLKK